MAAKYEVLKRDLAQQYHFDREAYTEVTTPFIAHRESGVGGRLRQ